MATTTSSHARVTARRIHGFGQSTPYSLGVEEEFQLVDPSTFRLVPVVEQVLGQLDDSLRDQVKHELMQSVVETVTPVCRGLADAAECLPRLRREVARAAESTGAALISAGTTPISCWEDQQVTDKPRYREIVARLQWVARRELIFGLHVHVGVDSADKCLFVFNGLREVLPEMLALSANSPFWQGAETGLQSSRVKVFDAFPRSGMPPAFPGGWDEWEALLRRGKAIGRVPDHTYVWWDVRPHPEFGTVEVRICDAQTRMPDTLALAALIQATVAELGDRFERGEQITSTPQMLLEENRWSAARYGLDGEFVDFTRDESVDTRHAIARLLDRVEPYSRQLGSTEWFDGLGTMLDRTGATRQIDAFRAGRGDLAAVGRQLVGDTAP